MINEVNKAPIIALDGNHRTGKGTQLAALDHKLKESGYSPIVLRGDGTRTGTGGELGDPDSDWWRNFKNFESQHENSYDAWRSAARLLLSEAAIWHSSLPANGVILFDRAGISRSQMTLKEGLRLNFRNMYGHRTPLESLRDEDIVDLQPDLTIFLSAPSESLLARLDKNDPKYGFRSRNIVNSNPYFEIAGSAYQELGYGAVTHMDARENVEDVADQVYRATIDAISQKTDIRENAND